VPGFEIDPAGHLIAADAVKGLLSIGSDGKVEVLADQVGGDPTRYADAVVVASNGDPLQRCLRPLCAGAEGWHRPA
jgi:hypothetical protein